MTSLAPDTGHEAGRATIPDRSGTTELLASILTVLQKLDSRMDEQSKCIQALTQTLASRMSKDVHFDTTNGNAFESTGSEEHGDFLRPGTPPPVPQPPLPDKPESFPTQKNNRISMPPSILMDNKHQRDQFKDAFQSSPFGQNFVKTERFATAAKMMESILIKPPGPIEIFVEDTEGHINQVDYTNDQDESYLGSKTLKESGSSSTDARQGGNIFPELKWPAPPKTSSYLDFPTPSAWIPGTRALTRNHTLVEPLPQVQLEKIGTMRLGSLWIAPPDGRVDFSFQSHHLKWLGHDKGIEQISQTSNLLQHLDDMEKNIRWDPCVLIEDYGLKTLSSPIQYLQTVRKIPKTKVDVPLLRHKSNSSRAGEYMAPWKRIVQLKGFSKLKGLIEKDLSPSLVTSEDMTPSVGPSFSHIFVSVARKYHDNVLRNLVQDTVEKHITCSRDSRVRLQIPKFLSINYTNFHLTFFELIKSSSNTGSSSWTTGKLYSDDTESGHARVSTESMLIRESACTILLIIDDDMGQYWTALYLRPETFKRYVRSNQAEDDDKFIATDLLSQAVTCVVNQWTAIAKHLKAFIVDHYLLLDPEGHDRLLFDDDSFSRSRKYFWVINFLAECDSRIEENLQEIGLARREWHQKLDLMDLYFQYMDEKVSELREIQSNLRVKRAETIALRDGLFSASAVMESRASTRLGENVKLLTFVSIFFVPLSFCTSLWSISDQIMSVSALAITITTVSLSTYLIVFNLNALVNISKTVYGEQRSKLIESMSSDPDTFWQEEGRRFKSFQPRLRREKPSEWWILVFLFRMLGIGLLWRGRRDRFRHEKGAANIGKGKEEAVGGNDDGASQDEKCEDPREVIGSEEQKSTDCSMEQVPRRAAVSSGKKSHTVLSIFARNKEKEDTMGEV